MRVTAFVTLILIATTLSGCSHRRGVQIKPSPRICQCLQCGDAQRRMMANKTVPTEHFTNDGSENQGEFSESAEITTPDQSVLQSPTAIETGGSCDNEYFATPAIVVEPSDTTELAAPTQQLLPINPAINDSPSLLVPEIPSEAIESLPIEQASPMLDPPQLPAEDLSKTEAADGELVLPKSNSEAASFDMETAPGPSVDSSFQPPITLTPPNREVVRPAIVDSPAISLPERLGNQPIFRLNRVPSFAQSAPESKQSLGIDLVEDSTAAATAHQTAPSRNSQEVPEQTVILHARQVAGVANLNRQRKPDPKPTPMPANKPVPASVADLTTSNRITNNSTVDPVYGLPLTDDVHFGALPEIYSDTEEISTSTEAANKGGNQPAEKNAHSRSVSENLVLKDETDCSQNHFHVHFHTAPNAKPIPTPDRQSYCDTCGIDGKAVQVVYRDEEGRVIMAPPTREDSLGTSAASPRKPSGDRQTYYVPPQRILRLKATTPIGQPKTDPSVASILMRDTVTVGGTHLLSIPARRGKNGMPLNVSPMLEQNRVIIDHDQLREALQRLAPTNQSGQEFKR